MWCDKHVYIINMVKFISVLYEYLFFVVAFFSYYDSVSSLYNKEDIWLSWSIQISVQLQHDIDTKTHSINSGGNLHCIPLFFTDMYHLLRLCIQKMITLISHIASERRCWLITFVLLSQDLILCLCYYL